MAGSGRKVFTAGDVLTASDVQNYMMDQSVMYFAGTAARSSAIATPTTGMTTYIGTTGTATIPQIEVYTGAAWQTPYGITQVANVSFSAVSSIAIDNVFTSAYTNYQVLVNVSTSSATANHTLNMRASGSTNSTANYFYGAVAVLYGSNTVVGSQSVNATTWTEANRSNTGDSGVSQWMFYYPQAAQKTFVQATTTDTSVARTAGMLFNATTQFDGFIMQPTSGTITGNIRVYGLRNS